jgi:TDG/mug DNA glycosylase family protein
MMQGEDFRESRPSVAAYFADLDQAAIPFLTALGQVVIAAAALEGNLRLELARLLFAAQGSEDVDGGKTLGEQVAELETLTAGQLLGRLRKRGLPKDLERRIDDAVSHRNQVVHHLFEDPQLVRAIGTTDAPDDTIGNLQKLALDCAALSVELQHFALPKIEASLGASKEELLDLVLSLDPAAVQQEAEREQLEAIQTLGTAAGLAGHSESLSSDPWSLTEHHRIKVDWMGEQVETLADLLRPGLRVVCIGINPSPISVAAGHYYQGKIGRRFWQRLQHAGVIQATGTGREDDAAFLTGIGFTDIVKRPTARASAISAAEFEHGRELLAEKLRRHRPALLVFTFKKTATTLLGPFKGHGHRPELEFEGAQIFVMPGPYERTNRVSSALGQLRDLIAVDQSA